MNKRVSEKMIITKEIPSNCPVPAIILMMKIIKIDRHLLGTK